MELAFIVLGAVGMYVLLKRKRQREQIELGRNKVGGAAPEVSAASLGEIMRSTNRRSFSPTEHRYILRFLETEARNGLVVRFHPTMEKNDVLAALNQGILLLHCPQIESDILFVKVNEGRGILGGEKSRFVNYISEPMCDTFTAGCSHKHLMLGLTGINNIFRHHGLIFGMAV